MPRILVVVFVLAAAGLARAAGPDCWDYAAGGWDPAAQLGGPGPAASFALLGDGRLAAGYAQGVGILDLADPLAPEFVGFLPTDAPVAAVAAAGDRVLALTGDRDLWYGAAADSIGYAWTDTLRLDDPIDRIALDDGVAALLVDGRAILALDLADPKNMAVGGFVIPPVGIYDVDLERGLAYVATQLDRFYVYDLSDPYAVTYLGSPLEGLSTGLRIAAAFPRVYVAGGDDVHAYDVSDPAAPVPVGSSVDISASISEIAVAKDRIYALTLSEQLVMFADPDSNRIDLLGHAALPERGLGLAARDDQVYAAFPGAAPLVFDSRDARHPSFAKADLEWRIEAMDMGASLGYAITTDGASAHRLEVLTFADGEPFAGRVGTLATVGSGVAVAAAEPLVAFASSLNDLTLVDVGDPAAPRYLGISSSQTVPRGLLLIGQGAYVANNGQGLISFDISNPAAPRLVGQATVPRTQVAWSKLDDYALIGMNGDLNGIFVVHCPAPEDMRIVAWVSLVPRIVDVLGFANSVYAADDQGRVHVYDMTDPADPRPARVLTVGEGTGRLAAWGRHVYYVDAKQGVVVLDAPGATDPALLGASLVPLEFVDIAARADGVFLRSLQAVSRLPLACGALAAAPPPPPSGTRLTAAPNPFNPRTVIRFSLDRPSACTLTVHDLRGRTVAVLLDRQPLGAGPREVAWDGRDAAGRDVASGVYVARLAGAGAPSTVRLALVR